MEGEGRKGRGRSTRRVRAEPELTIRKSNQQGWDSSRAWPRRRREPERGRMPAAHRRLSGPGSLLTADPQCAVRCQVCHIHGPLFVRLDLLDSVPANMSAGRIRSVCRVRNQNDFPGIPSLLQTGTYHQHAGQFSLSTGGRLNRRVSSAAAPVMKDVQTKKKRTAHRT